MKEAQTDGAVGAKCSRFRRPGVGKKCAGGQEKCAHGQEKCARGATWARREICDDREMLFNVFRGGARPSSIASTPLSILGV